MAILNRLPTMDRLQNWGIGIVDCCALCKQDQDQETRSFILWLSLFKSYLAEGIEFVWPSKGSYGMEKRAELGCAEDKGKVSNIIDL